MIQTFLENFDKVRFSTAFNGIRLTIVLTLEVIINNTNFRGTSKYSTLKGLNNTNLNIIFICVLVLKLAAIYVCFLQENLVESKHHKLARSLRSGPADRDLKPNATVRDTLNVSTEKGS